LFTSVCCRIGISNGVLSEAGQLQLFAGASLQVKTYVFVVLSYWYNNVVSVDKFLCNRLSDDQHLYQSRCATRQHSRLWSDSIRRRLPNFNSYTVTRRSFNYNRCSTHILLIRWRMPIPVPIRRRLVASTSMFVA
jgi:hypothetical protein